MVETVQLQIAGRVTSMDIRENANTPPDGRRFYCIQDNEDGSVDVYLNPKLYPLSTPDGAIDYDISVIVVSGVIPWAGMEDDIRARYDSWIQSGEKIFI